MEGVNLFSGYSVTWSQGFMIRMDSVFPYPALANSQMYSCVLKPWALMPSSANVVCERKYELNTFCHLQLTSSSLNHHSGRKLRLTLKW